MCCVRACNCYWIIDFVPGIKMTPEHTEGSGKEEKQTHKNVLLDFEAPNN